MENWTIVKIKKGRIVPLKSEISDDKNFCLSYDAPHNKENELLHCGSNMMNLKGEMSMLNVLHLEHTDIAAISLELRKKRDEMPQFFMQSPIVVDCSLLGNAATDLNFLELKESLLKLGFIPVGVRNISATMNAELAGMGWALMRESRKPLNDDEPQQVASVQSTNDAVEHSEQELSDDSQQSSELPQAPQAPVTFKSLTVDRPVRSGQQIYAANSDMTVLAPTSAGSEIMADGSIHVYGALRGRVLAGAMGNESARIYCQSLQAELIAIAGRYQLLDESDTKLIGKPAMIKLLGEKLIIEPLST